MRCVRLLLLVSCPLIIGLFSAEAKPNPQFLTGGTGNVAKAALGGILLGTAGGLLLSRLGNRGNRGRGSRRRGSYRGRGYRNGRDVDSVLNSVDYDVADPDMDEALVYLRTASQLDIDSCMKKMICSVNDPKADDYVPDENSNIFQEVFGGDDNSQLDYASKIVDLDLAAEIGKNAGADHCGLIYSRCTKSTQEILNEMHEAEKLILAEAEGNLTSI